MEIKEAENYNIPLSIMWSYRIAVLEPDTWANNVHAKYESGQYKNVICGVSEITVM